MFESLEIVLTRQYFDALCRFTLTLIYRQCCVEVSSTLSLTEVQMTKWAGLLHLLLLRCLPLDNFN